MKRRKLRCQVKRLIGLIALRLRYLRACRNPSVSAAFLTSWLSDVEDAERDVARHEHKSGHG